MLTPYRELNSAISVSNVASFARAHAQILAPFLANSSVIDRPIPLREPVMIAFLPLSIFLFSPVLIPAPAMRV